MNFKRLTCGSAIALAIGASVVTVGSGVAGAQPGPQPCQFGDCQGPGGPPAGGPGGPDGRDQGGHAGSGGPSPWHHNPGWGPPPPDQAWRGIDDGRRDHQPFNYNGNWVTPVFNPDFNNWGFWFFGIWIPL